MHQKKLVTTLLGDKTWWSYILVAASCAYTTIRCSTDRCYSVFYVHWMNQYNIGYTEVSQVFGAYYFGYASSALVVPVLVKHWTLRKWMMLIGIILSLSAFFSSFSVPFWAVVILFGVVPGLCFGIQMILVLQALTETVTKQRRVLALQLVFLGFAFGPFVGCPIWQVLISNYTWNGAILIISAVYLHTVAAGATMCPKTSKEILSDPAVPDEANAKHVDKNEEVPRCFGLKALQSIYRSYDLVLFSLPETYCLLLFYSGYASGFNVSTSYLIPYGLKEIGVTELQASFLPSALASGEISARLIVGTLFHKVPESKRKMFVVAQFTLAALLLILLPFLRSYIPLMALCVVLGLLEGAADGIFVNFEAEIFIPKHFASINTYCGLFGCAFTSLINLLTGVIVDHTGKLSNVFYLSATMYLLAVIGMTLLHFRHKQLMQSRRNKNEHIDTTL